MRTLTMTAMLVVGSAGLLAESAAGIAGPHPRDGKSKQLLASIQLDK